MIDHHQGWMAHTTHDADLVTIISDDDDQRLVEHCATGAMEWVSRGDVHPDAPFRTESAWGGQELTPTVFHVLADGPYPPRGGDLLGLGDRVEATGCGQPTYLIVGRTGAVVGFTALDGLMHVRVESGDDRASTTVIPLAQLRKA